MGTEIVSKRWIWPPNFDENIPETGGLKKVEIHLSATCEGASCAEESDVVKLDISELRKIDGTAPTRTVIEKMVWDISGFNFVRLEWDREPDALIAILSGRGTQEADITDPGEAGEGSGDIILTTDGMGDGASYDIFVTVRLK